MFSPPKRLLVVRFSSLGDVLLTIPVLQEVLEANPDVRLFVLTKKNNAPLLRALERTVVIEADLTGTHQGLLRLLGLFLKTIRDHRIEAVMDLHLVVRTFLLRGMCFFLRIPFFKINKEREKRKRFLRPNSKIALTPITAIYRKAFRDAGLQVHPLNHWGIVQKLPSLEASIPRLPIEKEGVVFIAPFAHYREKIYPTPLMNEVLERLQQHPKVKQLLLVGKGNEEERQIADWCNVHSKALSMCSLPIVQQLEWIEKTRVALVMDSANLHLAGLAEVGRIVVVFGATSARAGFSVWNHTVVLEKELPCHPCSIFGNKKCRYDRLRCMEAISPQEIVDAVLQEL